MAMYAERLKKLLFVTNQDELLALEAEEDEERHTHIIEHDHGAGWSSLWKFIGPGYLVAVGYMDPGNWATDIGGGAKFGYTLLFVVLLSSLMAMLFQALCIKLGVVTGNDLAQQCRRTFKPSVNLILYLLAELAIIATDLAEVIGSAIALNLLFRIPLAAGVIITALDALIILKWWGRKYQHVYEVIVFLLVIIVGVCFVVQLTYTKPNFVQILLGFLPSARIFTEPQMLFLAVGILGATVMPHNLYLHASICKTRKIHDVRTGERVRLGRLSSDQLFGAADDIADETTLDIKSTEEDDRNKKVAELTATTPLSEPSTVLVTPTSINSTSSIGLTLRYATIDTVIALIFAFFVNATILIVGASAFYQAGIHDVEELQDAYASLQKYVGQVAATMFAIALLASGQSSTVTGTMAGQIIMLGFLDLRLKPVIRRLATRLLAIIPALIVVLIYGDGGLNNLLILSQVILSCQLPFAVIPLVFFTSSTTIMSGGIAPDSTITRWLCKISPSNDADREHILSPDEALPRTRDTKLGDMFTNSVWLTILAAFSAVIVTVLNVYLVFAAIFGWDKN